MLITERPDHPESPTPPGEGRVVRHAPTVRPSEPGLGPPEVEASYYESRPAMLRSNIYHHDQSAGQTWSNDGSHVRVARRPGIPTGQHTDSLQPQRPTFRTPPTSWTDQLVQTEG